MALLAACACRGTPPAEPPALAVDALVESPEALETAPREEPDAYAGWEPRQNAVERSAASGPADDGGFECRLEVVELGPVVFTGEGDSATSAAEADRLARSNACDKAGLMPERCESDEGVVVVSQGARFSSTYSGGVQETRHKKTLTLREVVRRRVETGTSPDSAVSACVVAHRVACDALFGTPECPADRTTHRFLP